MHHVLITYCTLKSIYFAEIIFICDVGAIKLTDICSVRMAKEEKGEKMWFEKDQLQQTK